MHPVLEDLVTLLKLERIEENIFRGDSRDIGSPQVFGGQVLGQALSAAQHTVEDRVAHSLHAFFLRRGDMNAPIVYEVDRARDGGSFSNRRVVAIQHGRPILNMAASFQEPEDGFDHQSQMPDVPGPEGLKDMTEVAAALIERIGGDETLVHQLVDVHMSALYAQVRVLDHHPRVLEELRLEVSLALCSNFSHSETALRVLDEAELRAHLDVIAVSDVRGFRKPRPEIFEEALSGLGVTPAETLHVGDNLQADVEGAASLGIRTVWLTRRVKDPEARLERYEGPPPDFVLADLAELLPLVARLAR